MLSVRPSIIESISKRNVERRFRLLLVSLVLLPSVVFRGQKKFINLVLGPYGLLLQIEEVQLNSITLSSTNLSNIRTLQIIVIIDRRGINIKLLVVKLNCLYLFVALQPMSLETMINQLSYLIPMFFLLVSSDYAISRLSIYIQGLQYFSSLGDFIDRKICRGNNFVQLKVCLKG